MVMQNKTIYYTWFGGNDEPDYLKKNIESWKKFMPDYEVVRVDESNFDVNQSTFTKSAYIAKAWAFVSDYARLDVLYKFGGVYFDTDVELIDSIADILEIDSDSIWALENSNSIASGLFMAVSAPENRDIRDIMSQYDDVVFDENNIEKYVTTSIVTKHFAAKGFRFRNKIQRVDTATIFPTSYFAPFHWWGGGRVKKNTRAIHHSAASWVKSDEHIGSKSSFLSWNSINQNFILVNPAVYYWLVKISRKGRKVIKFVFKN